MRFNHNTLLVMIYEVLCLRTHTPRCLQSQSCAMWHSMADDRISFFGCLGGKSHGVMWEEVWCHEQDGEEESDSWLTLTGAHVTTGLEENSCLLIRAHHTLLNLREETEWFTVARYTVLHITKRCEGVVWYLSSGLDLFLANETFLDTGRAERAGGDVTAGAEERVSLHIRANHAFLQSFIIAAQRRATGTHLPTEMEKTRVTFLISPH